MIVKEHTRNQKRMYRIHKQEEKIHDLELLVGTLQQENKKCKEVIDKAINELFNLKDVIYKPETREENIDIQRKISSIIKDLNVKEVE